MSNLDPRIEQALRASLEAITRRGEVISMERLQASYAVFRSRFGLDKLNSLDGEALLEAMHTHGNKESLVYWLEFKNDEEFPGPMFGSISGGSAHKFGLFRRKDNGQWVKGSPQSEENISETEAVVIARKHRDQLLAGSRCLRNCPPMETTTSIGNSRNTSPKWHPTSPAWLGHASISACSFRTSSMITTTTVGSDSTLSNYSR